MKTTLTRDEAEAFLNLPDRVRIKFLKSLTPTERERIVVSVALASREEPAELETAA